MLASRGRTTGILGHAWRATVTPWGDIVPWDDEVPGRASGALVWAIAAEDRWHFPEREASTRQTWVRGTPVAETRVRVPNGDVVQRIWSASSRDGVSAILIEFTNDSPMALAISLNRDDVVTPRATHRLDDSERPWPSQDRGIERPALVIPLGHRARMRVALVRSGSISHDDVDAFPDWETVVRGWVSVADRASRIETPEMVDGIPLDDVVRARRCEMALDPPKADHSSATSSIRWLVAHGQLVRMGVDTVDVPDVVTALERLLGQIRRTRRRRSVDPAVADALRIGARMLGAVDSRAFADFSRALQRTMRRIGQEPNGAWDIARALAALPHPNRRDGESFEIRDESPAAFDLVSSIERDIVAWSAQDEVTLLPRGFDATGLGIDFEAHGVPAGPAHEISLAIRWHGERPAVIWEVDGPPGLLLRSGADLAWTSVEATGEALWSVPSASSIPS